MTFYQHPLSEAFPSMDAAAFEALTVDIAQHGQRDAIILRNGMILDGWHRYSSCLKLGIEPNFLVLGDNVDPVAFVKSHNLHRRHLTGSQRSAAVVACAEWAGSGMNQKNARTGEPGSPVRVVTVTELAKEADVSSRTIQHAKLAIAAGLGEAVKGGKITVKQGAAIARLPENQRMAAVANPDVLKLQQAPKPLPPDITLDLEQPRSEMVMISRAEYDDLLASLDEMTVMNGEMLAEQKSMESVLDADDKLAEAAKQIKMLTAQVATLTSSRDGYMNGKNEILRLLKSRDREIAHLKKVLAPHITRFDSEEMPI
jgi:hypothetical protein